MRRTSFSDMNCSLAQAVEIVGERWTPLILRDALMGITRFDQFQTRLGIARNVLTQRLDLLVERGLMERVLYQDRPPRYDYRLTAMGRDLWPALVMLRQWGDRWLAPDGAPMENVHETCGHVLEAVLTCSHCDDVVRGRDLELRPGPGWSADDRPILPEPQSLSSNSDR